MPQVVTLNGEMLVKRYDKMHINCSSDTVPLVNAADIYVEEAFFNIRYYRGRCFTTALTSTCLPEVCQCSSRGLWYSHSFNVTYPDGFIYIRCSMLFGLKEVYSENMNVRIVGKCIL